MGGGLALVFGGTVCEGRVGGVGIIGQDSGTRMEGEAAGGGLVAVLLGARLGVGVVEKSGEDASDTAGAGDAGGIWME